MFSHDISWPTLAMFVIVVFLLLEVIWYDNKRGESEKKIVQYLTNRGATDIKIEYQRFGSSRFLLTFYVEYIGIQGNQQSTSCKVDFSPFATEELFWTTLPELNEPPNEPKSIEVFAENNSVPAKVLETLSIPNSDDQIILLDYTKPCQNVLRCQRNGSVVWKAELPTSANDAYTNVTWRDGELHAFSKSLIAVKLDVATGKIVT